MEKIKIKTSCGSVCGRQSDSVVIFQGIPYATTDRFEKPVMITKWKEEIDATKRGTDCLQYGAFRDESKEHDNFYYKEFRINGGEPVYGEGIVNLNIVSPIDSILEKREKLPVMIFIHGGGHETGTVGELPGGITTEYAKRGIVYVSIGYRLNVFSLFDAMNLGLFDQLTAIEWLKNNIDSFGGDPDKMTLIGQSAGAMSIMNLCYSDKLKGVIQGVIVLSGGGVIPAAVGPLTREQMWPFWERVMKQAGAANKEELKKVDAKVLWEAWFHCSRNPYNLKYVQPGIDGEIIKDTPQKLIKQGKQLDVPYIVGVTSQDFMPLFAYEMALKWGKIQNKAGMQSVYGSFFDQELPGNLYKAFHEADLWYVFGNRNKSWRPFGKEDDKLSDMMMDYYSNFVKTGNPNAKDLPEWKPIGKTQKKFRWFKTNEKEMISPISCRKKMWYTFLKDKGPM